MALLDGFLMVWSLCLESWNVHEEEILSMFQVKTRQLFTWFLEVDVSVFWSFDCCPLETQGIIIFIQILEAKP